MPARVSGRMRFCRSSGPEGWERSTAPVTPRLGRGRGDQGAPGVVRRDPSRLARFEAGSAHRRRPVASEHSRWCSDIGAGEHAYLVTELLEGETLRAAIAHGAALPETDRGARAAAGRRPRRPRMAAASSTAILKPENIFLTADGLVKILDFGLAKMVAPVAATAHDDNVTRGSDTLAGIVVGTGGYMAPEQVRGESGPTPGSDLFAVGHDSVRDGQRPPRVPR